MKSKFSLLFIGLLVIVAIFSFKAQAVNDPGNYTFNGTHEYDAGAILKIGGAWYIGGTKITATAATLNNAASGLSTNETQEATCSNLTVTGTASIAGDVTVSNVTATGTITATNLTVYSTITVPAGSIAHTKLVAGGAGACIITNLSTLSTNIMWFDAAGCLTNKTTSP